MTKVRHVLGISGGKDSAALAIYMKNNYPQLDIEYYTSDTGRELDETYKLIEDLELFLGKKIIRLNAAENSPELPFDHFLKMYGGFLPSSNSRWCTKKLKLEPFEKFVGSDLVVSYVGIRGDEDREGYISRKSNIQSIFPFRKNIWSEDVVLGMFQNNNIINVVNLFDSIEINEEHFKKDRFKHILETPTSLSYSTTAKVNQLLDLCITEFNKLVFAYLKTTSYPLSQEDNFPLVTNADILVREDIFAILNNSGIGVPSYYKEIRFAVGEKSGYYARSRSGCFFCFYQQKIEWVWLFEQHPQLFFKAMEYEKDGYTWMQDEPLIELIKPARIAKIKEDYIKRTEKSVNSSSPYLIDILSEAEVEGCASCFI